MTKHKIVVDGGTVWYWWSYIEGAREIATSTNYYKKGATLRSARRFASKFIDPPEVVVEESK